MDAPVPRGGGSAGAYDATLFAEHVSPNPFLFVLFVIVAVAVVGTRYTSITSVHAHTFHASFALGMVIAVTGRYRGPAAETMVYAVMAVVLIFKPLDV